MEFEPAVSHVTGGKTPEDILYCLEHNVIFACVTYPPDAKGLLVLRSAEAVAQDHMKALGCRVIWIEPHISH